MNNNINFFPITIEHNKQMSEILELQTEKTFSRCFGSYFLWGNAHKTAVCIDKNMVYIKYENPYLRFEFPKGIVNDKDIKQAVENLINYGADAGCKKFIFTRLLKNEVKKLEEIFPNKFEFTQKREDFEYLYSKSDLENLKGRKYHSKRNHISKFSRLYNWKYNPIDISKKEEYLNFFDLWFKTHSESNPLEHAGIKKAIDFYNELKLIGGSVDIDGKIVACTIGEKLDNETYVVHYEKALNDFPEAYTVVNNQFCSYLDSECKIINREEDLGLPGLRKAKMSYQPIGFVEKYDAIFKNF